MIDLLRGNELAVERMREIENSSEAIAVAAPSVVELATGAALAESSREGDQLNELLSSVTTLPLDKDAALLAGKLQAELIRAGETIGHVNTTIGAIARSHGEHLLTKNAKHFARIPGLEVEEYSAG